MEKGLKKRVWKKSHGKFWYMAGVGNICLSWSMERLLKFRGKNGKKEQTCRGRSEVEAPPAIILTKLFPTQLSTGIVYWIHCISNDNTVFKTMIKWNNEYNEPGIVFLHNKYLLTSFFCLIFFGQLGLGRCNRLFWQEHVFHWKERSDINNLSLIQLYFSPYKEKDKKELLLWGGNVYVNI